MRGAGREKGVVVERWRIVGGCHEDIRLDKESSSNFSMMHAPASRGVGNWTNALPIWDQCDNAPSCQCTHFKLESDLTSSSLPTSNDLSFKY